VNTVSRFGDEATISQYVKDQGIEKEYKVFHKATQLEAVQKQKLRAVFFFCNQAAIFAKVPVLMDRHLFFKI
jgi:hypothetical protein